MRVVELVLAIGWAAFWLYWLVAAFSMKRGRVPWSRELGIRVAIVVVVILLLRLGAFRGTASTRSGGALASGSPCSLQGWGSRSGRGCTSGATRASR